VLFEVLGEGECLSGCHIVTSQRSYATLDTSVEKELTDAASRPAETPLVREAYASIPVGPTQSPDEEARAAGTSGPDAQSPPRAHRPPRS
jgi:hypothetical protein